MTISALALAAVLGCSLSFSALDLLRKVLGEWIRPLPLLVILSAGQLPMLVAWKAVSPGGWPDAAYALPATISVALNIVANLLFLQALRVSPLSLTIPLLSLTPVFATLLAWVLLGESVSLLKGAGVLLVVAGAFRLNIGRQRGRSLRALWGAFAAERGSLLMAGTALCWSLAMPLDKLALKSSSPAFHALVLNAGVGLATLALLAARGRTGELREAMRRPCLVGAAVVASAAAIALQLVAMSLIWVGFVETVKRALGSGMALLLGAWLYREEITLNRLGAVALLAVGVALVLWQ